EEAFVAGAGVPRWQSQSLGRPQAIALGSAAGAVVAAASAAAAIAVHRRRATRQALAGRRGVGGAARGWRGG
ncbi:MAG: hypothetical protein JO085_04800, partial [Acidimicrobiia bacterium]|nr:hypothetical protein [Acidimicrobiia bacterium]